MKTIIYIAGKVSGENPANCSIKFGSAEKALRDKGFEVINPLKLVDNINTPWKTAMRLCIYHLMSADAVLLLHDHEQSRGATIEKNLALELGIPVHDNIESLNQMID